MTRRTITTAFAATLLMGACDSQAPTPDELTPEAAHALFVALTQGQATELFLSVQTLQGNPPTKESGDTVVVSCPDGGKATLVGGLENSLPVKVSLDYTVTPDECEFATDDGDQFTIDGDPSVRDLLDFKVGTDGMSVTGSIKGSLSWELDEDDMEGTCDLDMNLTKIEDDWAYKGTMCGHAIEVKLPKDYGI